MRSAPPRVALVTCSLQPLLYGDERELLPMLAARGVDAVPVCWDDAGVAWATFDAIVIRSTWDYCERYAEFLAWLARVERSGARVCASPPLARWNADKRYLRELEAKGVRIVPTAFIEAKTSIALADVMRERGWDRGVVKPAVSGGAYRTHRFDAREAGAHQAHLDEISRETSALVQPYMPEIESEGEWSIVFFDGAFSHAVVKVPARGDYRIQEQFGGTYAQAAPSRGLLAQAEGVIAALPEPPAYARIDGIRRGDDFYLMEAELIEPYLFLRGAPGAAERYVSLVERLARGQRAST